jgi:hypothetical protein
MLNEGDALSSSDFISVLQLFHLGVQERHLKFLSQICRFCNSLSHRDRKPILGALKMICRSLPVVDRTIAFVAKNPNASQGNIED